MGFFFEQKTGSKGIIYDEGNNIILMTVGERINRQMLISRDYRSELCFLCDDDKAYICYFNTQNDLVWHTVGVGERLILFSGSSIDALEIRDLKIEKIDNIVYVFYVVRKQNNNQYEIRYISPLGNRNAKTFLNSEYPVEAYEFIESDSKKLLKLKLLGESTSRQYVLNIDKMGEAKFEEYKWYKCDDLQAMCREIEEKKQKLNEKDMYIEQLKREIKESTTNIEIMKEEIEKNKTIIDEEKQSLHKAQEVYDNMLQSEMSRVEEQYKKQYDELAKLTKEIQEEGKRWRELYYKNVKK